MKTKSYFIRAKENEFEKIRDEAATEGHEFNIVSIGAHGIYFQIRAPRPFAQHLLLKYNILITSAGT